MAHMLLDAHGHVEVAREHLAQHFGMPAAVGEPAGLEGERSTRQHAAVGRCAATGEEPLGEAVVLRAIVLHHRLRLGPGAVEEREQSVVEDVEKMRERAVGVVQLAVARHLGQVQRHRPLRSEQAEEAHRKTRRQPGAQLHRMQRRRREVERRRLRQPQRLLARTQRMAGAWPLAAQRVDTTQQREEVERRRVGAHTSEQLGEGLFVERRIGRGSRRRGRVDVRRRCGAWRRRRACAFCRRVLCCAHAVLRPPSRGGQVLMTPRCPLRMVSCVKLLMAAWRAKKRSSTLPSKKALAP